MFDSTLAADIDTMRDVYLSRAQREAYERIVALAQPAGDARGAVVVDDAMVERAMGAYMEADGSLWLMHASSMHHALVAALTQEQPHG